MADFLLIDWGSFLFVFIYRQDCLILERFVILCNISAIILLLFRILALGNFRRIWFIFIFVFSLALFFEVVWCNLILSFLRLLLTLLFLSFFCSIYRLCINWLVIKIAPIKLRLNCILELGLSCFLIIGPASVATFFMLFWLLTLDLLARSLIFHLLISFLIFKKLRKLCIKCL